MAKYHINQASGEVGVCKAETKCPFGDLERDHYADADGARAAYEAQMAGNSIVKPVKRSLWDKLRGVSEEEAAAAAKAEAEALFQANFDQTIRELEEEVKLARFAGDAYIPRENFLKLFTVAKDYRARQRESVELLAHFDALTEKKEKIEKATEALADENKYAFEYSGWLGRAFLEHDGYRLLQPGQDKNLFEDLKPRCEALIAAHNATLQSRDGVSDEALALNKTIIEEAALSAGDRAQLSDRTRELLTEALEFSSPAIPQPEALEDRRAWSAARAQALAEFKERDQI